MTDLAALKTANEEYLYEFALCSIRPCGDCPHESARYWIVRRTAKRVYVERRPYDPRFTVPRSGKPWIIDRAKLERDGGAHVLGNGWAIYLYRTAPRDLLCSFPVYKDCRAPRCARLIGLTKWPCTVREAQMAYRHLTKTAHPDHGGNGPAFRALRTAYEQTLRRLRA